MTPLQFKNIRIFKWSPNMRVGFHNDTLEVAGISKQLVDALENPSMQQQEEGPSSPLEELRQWSDKQSQWEIELSLKRSILRSPGSEQVERPRLKTLTINSTQLCNLRCVYCAAGGNGTYGAPIKKFDLKQGLPQLEMLLDLCSEGDQFNIQFMGGEPLLFPEQVSEIASRARELSQSRGIDLRFGVVTNGTHFLKEGVLDLLKNHSMGVTVSIDGPPTIQNQFRPMKDGEVSSEKIVNGLQALFAEKSSLSSVVFSAVFHPGSVDVLKTYQYFLNWPFDFCEFTYSHTDGGNERGEQAASEAFARNLRETMDWAYRSGGEALLRKIKSVNHFFNRLDEQIPAFQFCGAGKTLFSLDARGDMYSCPWEVNRVEKKWTSPIHGPKEVRAASSPTLSRIECETCWARHLCGGGCQFIHDRSIEKNGQMNLAFCQRMKDLIESTIYYYYLSRGGENETH